MENGRGRASKRPLGRGFDYGIGITVGAVGSMEFNNNLIAADILAVAYGFDYSQALDTQVPAITLVGKNESPLRKAFGEFWSWAKETDADAVELTIVLGKSGGYHLCIGPEVGALYKRALRFDAVANPLAFQLTWIKPIQTTSQPLRDFRDYVRAGPVRPFLLRAANYAGPLPISSISRPDHIRLILEQQELLKFEVRFVDEDSDKDLQWQNIILGKEEEKRDTVEERKTIPKSMVWSRRKESLKSIFPVTLWRSRSSELFRHVRTEAENRGLRDWQIEQALCNIVLSREACGGKLHFCEFSDDNWLDSLWEALRDRFEVSGVDHDGFTWLTIDDIERQVMLDGKVLLNHYGAKDVEDDIRRVQRMLEEQSLIGDLA